jgi:hypothetical protein
VSAPASAAVGLLLARTVLLLVAEPALTTGLGVTVGLGVGLALLRVLFAVGYSDLPFLVDWTMLAASVAGSWLLLVVACCAAAWPAARRPWRQDLADLG